jgi:hypothetical protein
MASIRRLLLTALPLLLLVGLLPASRGVAQDAAPSLNPVDQATLTTWWKATNALWMGDTAYRADGVSFEDGVCSYRFDEGIFIPVFNGKAPVAEQQIGVVFVGSGAVSMHFPESGDASAFANHMVRQAGADAADLRAIAAGEAPFSAAISRGMILSADPAVQKLLYDLEPVGGGVMYSETTEEGVDAQYVVTERRGKLRARVVATNLLPNRRNELVKIGLDPVAMLRQDRLLHTELGFPGEQLRLVADFDTDTSFRVAAEDGATISDPDYDQWLTCYRDGLGQSDLGYHSAAFTYGRDNEGDLHFQRFSGTTWSSVTGEDEPRPPVRMEPVRAEVEISAQPANFFANAQHARVESTLTVKPVGAAQRHIVMSLPASRAIEKSWKLDKLALADGTPLPWVSLTADLTHRDTRGRQAQVDEGGASEQEASEDVGSATAQDGSSGGGVDAAAAMETSASEVESDLGQTVDIGERGESRALYQRTAQRFEIIALLPEAVPEGQEVEIQLDWQADWQYANWSYEGQPLGTTTGFQPVLPELMPELYENAWDFGLRMSVPGVSLRTFSVAASGDTVDKWEDMDSTGRKWVETQGSNARDVGVAIGQWKERDEPAHGTMPGVSVHLFFQQAAALQTFPPEVRRVVSFMDRFLPPFPQTEVEIWQGASTFAGVAMREGFYDTAYGLTNVTTVKQYTTASGDLDVGEASAVRDENPYLAQFVVARQVAHQYFGQSISPATERDRWLETALSDAYAGYYVRAAIGKDAFDERLEAVREGLEDPVERELTYKRTNRYRRPYSLTGSTSASDISSKMRNEYGFYFMGHMLRRKMGDQPYFLAIDRMTESYAGRALSTERFQELMEAASGQDLGAYFDFWVHGGSIPDITLDYRIEAHDGGYKVHGCIVSDVPFGTFEVPVQLYDPPTGRIVAGPVTVTDGMGRFDVAGWTGEPELELDPEKLILAYGRKVDRIKGTTTCEDAEPQAPEPAVPEPAEPTEQGG